MRRGSSRIALIGASHWDITVDGAFPVRAGVGVGEVTHEGAAGGTLNAASHLLSRRPLLITQRPALVNPRHAKLLDQVDLVAADTETLSTATITVDRSGDRSIFLARRPTPWPVPPERLRTASVVDWHWTAPAALLPTYAPLLVGRVVASARSVSDLCGHGIAPWLVIDSLADYPRPTREWLASVGCTWCVMTDGERGGQYWAGDSWSTFVPEPGEIVDTTGCGDAFRSGLMAAMDDGSDLSQAVALGARWAAATARHRGGNALVNEVPDRSVE